MISISLLLLLAAFVLTLASAAGKVQAWVPLLLVILVQLLALLPR